MANDYRIRIGAMGWEYPQWYESFYPDDLPDDWQLAFYGNEFPVVGVPQSCWTTEPLQQIESWLENSGEHLAFVFEHRWQDSVTLQQFIQQLVPFAEHNLGILLQVSWQDCIDNIDLQQCLTTLESKVAICLEVLDENRQPLTTGPDFSHPGFQQLLTGNHLTCCWHGTEPEARQFWSHGRLALTRIVDADITGRALRQVLETCSAVVQPGNDMVILFTGNPPSIKTLREAVVIQDLLA